MQKLQCVQDGSSTIAKISSNTRASTGHNATHAAQPKQRSLSTTNIELTCLGTLLRGGDGSQ